jgi:hypothetical protein
MLAQTMDYSGFDLVCETGVNWKLIVANIGCWMAEDFSPEGISDDRKKEVLGAIRKIWESRRSSELLPRLE